MTKSDVMIVIDKKTNLHVWKHVLIVDLTTTNRLNIFAKLSPYYPHGGIPINYSPYLVCKSVNEVWQKLCVNINRTNQKDALFRKGVNINEYWTYSEARKKILIPTYRWMLENKAFDIVCSLRDYNNKEGFIVLIDNTINSDTSNLSQPLSFAYLLKAYIECTFPYEDAMEEFVEYRNFMIGQRDYCVAEKKKRPKFIEIYTNAQRRLGL